MRSRSSRSVTEVGQVRPRKRSRVGLTLAVPVLSLVVPAVAVDIASAGGSGLLTRAAAEVARFLLFYSGVFALVALSAAVAAGLLASDRILMSPERRIFAQVMHRTTSLVGISALANHIMLEVLAHRAGIADGFVPFMASRNTFFMGLGTVASDLFVVIIVTGMLRRRFIRGARRQLWRWLHATAYVAWPMAILHGLLAGRHAKPYVDWSYGVCLAAVGLALIIRSVAGLRGRSGGHPAPVRQQTPSAPGTPLPRSYQISPQAPVRALAPGLLELPPVPRRPGDAWAAADAWASGDALAPADAWANGEAWAPPGAWTGGGAWAPPGTWTDGDNWNEGDGWSQGGH
jgi:hypothetical protein